MNLPSPQRYRSEGRLLGIDEITVENAIATIERLRGCSSNLTPIFTLRHLSYLTRTDYGYLRHIVQRNVEYRHFRLAKKVPGRSRYRLISVPPYHLSKIQRWLSDNILCHLSPSNASFAYHPESSPRFAAEQHCGCKWLLKIDIEDFFHTVSEGRVAEIFYKAGYPRLLSFEMARITTCVMPGSAKLALLPSSRWPAIAQYQQDFEGVLPQGAPSSPMLSNLAMRSLDERLIRLSKAKGMVYTRYADDLAFSSASGDADGMNHFKRIVLRELSTEGFKPNRRKTLLRGPGSRRIVLGVLVDGKKPRLTPEFKEKLRQHIYFLTSDKHGPYAHAKARGTSISGIYHHVKGLISWARSIEPEYGDRLLKIFRSIDWPPLQPQSLPENFEDWL